MKDFLLIECPLHGMFTQRAITHRYKCGCPKCGRRRCGKSKSRDQFIREAIEIHGDKYSYDDVIYVNNKTKVIIYCKACEENFEQIPHKHLVAKRGCPKCGMIRMHVTVDIFLDRARAIHGNKYDYSQVNYLNTTTKITIKCNTCYTAFSQTPANHMLGYGCYMCGRRRS